MLHIPRIGKNVYLSVYDDVTNEKQLNNLLCSYMYMSKNGGTVSESPLSSKSEELSNPLSAVIELPG